MKAVMLCGVLSWLDILRTPMLGVSAPVGAPQRGTHGDTQRKRHLDSARAWFRPCMLEPRTNWSAAQYLLVYLVGSHVDVAFGINAHLGSE